MKDKTRIIVLDDSPIAARLAKAQLENLGFEVQAAVSLNDFQKIFESFLPQIILTDVEMPDVTGDEICRVLRNKIDTSHIPILLFSGLSEDQLSARALKAGADGYICKDSGIAGLKTKLNDLLADIVF